MTIHTISARTAPLTSANVTNSLTPANQSDISGLFRQILQLKGNDRLRLCELMFAAVDSGEVELLTQLLAAEQFRRKGDDLVFNNDDDDIDHGKDSDVWALSPAKDYRSETSSQLYIYVRQRKRGSKRHFLGKMFRMDAEYEYQYELQDTGRMVFKGVTAFKLSHKRKANTCKVIQIVFLDPPTFELSDATDFKRVQIPLRVQFLNSVTFEPSRVVTLDFPYCFSDGGELSFTDWKAEPIILS